MRNRKIKILSTIILFIFIILIIISRPASGYAEDLQGYTVSSEYGGDWYTDPNVQWNDGTSYYGNITGIEVDDENVSINGADDALNYGFGGNIDDDFDVFDWDASTAEPKGWYSSPDTVGENLMLVGQYDGISDGLSYNYTWCANVKTTSSAMCPVDPLHLMVRYEPIPQPSVINYGSSWINISIDHFKYTDYNSSKEASDDRGTYHCFKSYAVFIKGVEFSEWTYLGNSKQDPNSPPIDPPLDAYNSTIDPTTIDTGADYFNATGLGGGEYRLMARINFAPVDGTDQGPVWGYGGGLGSITTFVSNAYPVITIPEFHHGPIIPALCTVGIFLLIVNYRKFRT